MHAMQLHCFATKLPNLKLKTWTKQLLDSLIKCEWQRSTNSMFITLVKSFIGKGIGYDILWKGSSDRSDIVQIRSVRNLAIFIWTFSIPGNDTSNIS
jgi:hypothetical protein